MKLKGNHSQQAWSEILDYELRYNLPRSYIMFLKFLSSWVLSLINDCLPRTFPNSRLESCVVLLEHGIIVKFGFDMTSCEIGPINLAVQENSFIHSCFWGESPISVYTKCEWPATEFMHEGHQRDQLWCCLICSVDIIIVLRFAKRSDDQFR